MPVCPECGYESYDLDEFNIPDPSESPMNIKDGASAILSHYMPMFGLGDRLKLEGAIKKCLIDEIGVGEGVF